MLSSRAATCCKAARASVATLSIWLGVTLFRLAICALKVVAMLVICVSAVWLTLSCPVTTSIAADCAARWPICGRRSSEVSALAPSPA